MPIVLGKDATNPPPFGVDIISATFTEEAEAIDVTNRDNKGGSTGSPGYRAFKSGFKSETWEIECHDATGLITSLETNTVTSNFLVMSVTENASVDGAITYTVTCRRGKE
jgi:hypothetical protein